MDRCSSRFPEPFQRLTLWPPESAGREMAVQWMTLLCYRCYILTKVTETEEPRGTHLQWLLVNLSFPLFSWWPPSGLATGQDMSGEASASAGILCPSICLFLHLPACLCPGDNTSLVLGKHPQMLSYPLNTADLVFLFFQELYDSSLASFLGPGSLKGWDPTRSFRAGAAVLRGPCCPHIAGLPKVATQLFLCECYSHDSAPVGPCNLFKTWLKAMWVTFTILML